jgi:lysophospholipase L1-like esterase
MIMNPLRSSVVHLAAVGAAFVLSATAPSAGQRAKFNPPKQYYLALGDSIAYGYQARKARAGLPPAAFNTGYVDVFAGRLRQIQPGLTVVNYGCPGETTTTFIGGGCPATTFGFPLHDAFEGAQLGAAIAFLRAHRGEVSPITLTLWGNDVREFVASCPDEACVARGLPQLVDEVTNNLRFILDHLREAAPDAEIIVTGSWDSYLDSLEFADPLFQVLNGSMAATAASTRVRFADPFPLFNPAGDLDAEIQALCTMTLLCTQQDSHPSDIGYRALAELVFGVSDYGRRARP